MTPECCKYTGEEGKAALKKCRMDKMCKVRGMKPKKLGQCFVGGTAFDDGRLLSQAELGSGVGTWDPGEAGYWESAGRPGSSAQPTDVAVWLVRSRAGCGRRWG